MKTKKQYKQALTKVENEITLLNSRLKEHQIKFLEQQGNWGYIGDLNNLHEKLQHLNDFFKHVEVL